MLNYVRNGKEIVKPIKIIQEATLPYYINNFKNTCDIKIVITYSEDTTKKRKNKNIISVLIYLPKETYEWNYSDDKDSQLNDPFGESLGEGFDDNFPGETDEYELQKLHDEIINIVDSYCDKNKINGIY